MGVAGVDWFLDRIAARRKITFDDLDHQRVTNCELRQRHADQHIEQQQKHDGLEQIENVRVKPQPQQNLGEHEFGGPVRPLQDTSDEISSDESIFYNHRSRGVVVLRSKGTQTDETQ